eukprot:TRINITY_DN9786_c0_g2_i1.p1 TRINITY_DN9786_c0_g2~~TRINITY_DN9786_c0_g2_i1.p1  ORF type:complete len:306 (+),score=14.77 TRINITY_DN9786_c0_g2_i1:11-928(+)
MMRSILEHCSSHGFLKDDGICECFVGWFGKDCNECWVDDDKFFAAYIAQLVFTVLLNVTMIIYCTNQLSIHLRSANNKVKKWNIIITTYSLLIVGVLFRLFQYAIDPDGFWEILPRSLTFTCGYISSMCCFVATIVMALFWLEIRFRSLRRLENIEKTKPVLVVLLLFVTLVLFPLAILASLYQPVTRIFLVLMAILLIVNLIFIVTAGVLLKRALRNMKSEPAVQLYKRLNYYITVITVSMAMLGILVGLLTAIRGNKWTFIVIVTLVRLCEFIVIMNLALFMRRKAEDFSFSSESIEQSSQKS